MNTPSFTDHLYQMFHLLTSNEMPPITLEKRDFLRHQLLLGPQDAIHLGTIVSRTCQVLSNTALGSVDGCLPQVIDLAMLRLTDLCARDKSCSISLKCLQILNMVQKDIISKRNSKIAPQLNVSNIKQFDNENITMNNIKEALCYAVENKRLDKIAMCFSLLGSIFKANSDIYEANKNYFLWEYLTGLTESGFKTAILCARGACLIKNEGYRDICLRFLKEKHATEILRTEGTFEIRIIDDEMNLHSAHVFPEILGTLNIYFGRLIDSGFHESRIGSITLLDIAPEIYMSMLDYIHGGKICLTQDNVYELIRLSDQYLVSDLKLICEKFLMNGYDKGVSSLSIEKLHEELAFGELYSSMGLLNNMMHKLIRTILQDAKYNSTFGITPHVNLLLQYCRYLKTLDITLCLSEELLRKKVEGKSLVSLISWLPCLTSVNLGYCEKLNDAAAVNILKSLTNLQTLSLSDCLVITLTTIQSIVKSHSGSLTSLNLSGCRLIDYQCIETITKSLSGLKELSLRRCPKIRDSGLICLAESSIALESLEIGGFQCGISDYGLKRLAVNQTSLRELDISWCADANNTSLIEIASHLTKLESLNLTDCNRISDHAVVQIATHLTSLRELHLSMCYDLTNISLAAIEVQLPNLEVLGLGRCNSLKESGLLSLFYHLSKLRFINLTHCPAATDRVVLTLAHHCPLLESIDLGLTQITNTSVQALLKESKKLRHLNLQKCENISDAPLKVILEECIPLESINLTGCYQVSKEMLAKLRERGLNVIIVN